MSRFIEVTAAIDNPDPYYEKVMVNLDMVRSVSPISEKVRKKTMSNARARLNYEGFGAIDVCETYEELVEIIKEMR